MGKGSGEGGEGEPSSPLRWLVWCLPGTLSCPHYLPLRGVARSLADQKHWRGVGVGFEER